MRGIGSIALAVLVIGAANLTTARPADARISCSWRYGCIEGKSARKPVAGKVCRTSANKHPGRRYHFFCSPA